MQPQITAGEGLDGARAISFAALQQTIQDIMSLKGLTHTGILSYSFKEWGVEPDWFLPCGGELHFSETARRRVLNRFKLFLSCSACGISLGIEGHPYRDMGTMLFHLARKQMNSQLHTCNYLDCGRWYGEDELEKAADKGENPVVISKKRNIRDLGMISLKQKSLFGFSIPNTTEDDRASWCDIGFMFVPGMNTAEHFDGFDVWERVLNLHQSKMFKNCFSDIMWALLGPKHNE